MFISRLRLRHLGNGADGGASLSRLLCALGEIVHMECVQFVAASRASKY